MSGGSYNYAYSRIEDLAYEMAKNARTPERKAFVKLLGRVAKAAKAIEWVDSGDWNQDDETEEIQEALGCQHKELSLLELIEEAEMMVKTMNQYINSAKNQI